MTEFPYRHTIQEQIAYLEASSRDDGELEKMPITLGYDVVFRMFTQLAGEVPDSVDVSKFEDDDYYKQGAEVAAQALAVWNARSGGHGDSIVFATLETLRAAL